MASATVIGDLPDAILSNIFALLSDVRSRNSLSLVCRKFLALERATRVSLTLRGNARDLFLVPSCFRSVAHLDLSLLSPWGHFLFLSPPTDHPDLVAHRLRLAFPAVESLTVYSRSPACLELIIPHWPELRRVKLVRWHQRSAQIPLGADFVPIFENRTSLESLDLSEFYHWTEDLPPVLRMYADVSAKLTRLCLLTVSITDGYKSTEIAEITKACPNLTNFQVACTFDARFIGFVGDETLMAVATNCPKLMLLHMVDTTSLTDPRARLDPECGDARITPGNLVEFFSALPLLEEIVLDVGKNTVKESGVALEILSSKCRKLRVLKLGQFQGVCPAIDWRKLDGVALCGSLESLAIKNSSYLTDMGLVAIGRGCCRLVKFEVQGCDNITVDGLRSMTSLLRKTLVDVKISCCKNLDAACSLRAVEPIRKWIQGLHFDCVWSGLGERTHYGFDLDKLDGELENGYDEHDEDRLRENKRCKYSSDEGCSSFLSNGNGLLSTSKGWNRLRYLSLWIGAGELLNPLTMVGLDECPNLEEIRIKIEGDCRGKHKPLEREFGLSCLMLYPNLFKMQLDCSDTIGYTLTAPPRQMDLTLWERFFLNGIGHLNLTELDYWPPQDREVNQRSLSLPAAGLLQECHTLRKLFIHGTAHEHFMNFFLKILCLRDVQLRGDYYPAPENDMSTEMRVGSCSRFEDALNCPSRYIGD